MPRSYSRTLRVSDLIQTELAKILQEAAGELKLGMVTITDVEMSPDLSFAKVFISVLEDNRVKEVIDTLNEETKTLRFVLAKRVKLRIVPDLKFFYDDSLVRGSRISSLIDNALKKEK